MSRKIKIILLVVLGILVIAGLVAGAYWFGTRKTKKKEENKTSSYPSAWTEKSKDQTKESIENQIDSTSLEYETWNSGKEGLTLKYPKTWVKSEISDLSQIATKEELGKYKLSMPLLVSFPSAEKLLQITVTRYEFADDKITNLIATLIEESQKKVSSITVVDQKNNERVLVIENKYKKDELELHTKEKLILLTAQGNSLPGYIISFSTLEKDWLEYKKVVEYVIDSAVLTDGSITNIESTATNSTTSTTSLSEKECLAKGGTWGTIGIFSKEETCNLPTTDANKECRDNSECQGECIAENSQSVLGKCNNRKINIGCRYFMANGKAVQICSD